MSDNDDSDIIEKRLHISGLTTTAITTTDLEKRLSAFGRVISLDGFGKFDALGQLRPFGYATIQGRRKDLTRCVNVLSGTLWKGSKLRIGDAKPDFRERLALSASLSPPIPKKRRLNSLFRVGTHATDMSLITLETARTRGGWKVTDMGRLVRIMRMRPDKPLDMPRVLSTTYAGNRNRENDGKAGTRKHKKRVKPPPTRARRQTIDPTRWDSVHLKGIWLDADVVPESAVSLLSPPDLTPSVTGRPPTSELVGGETLRQEKFVSLALLRSLFGDNDKDEEWGGQEGFSDVEDARPVSKRMANESPTGTRVVSYEGDAGGEIQEVPRVKYNDWEIGSDSSDGVRAPLKPLPHPAPQSGQTAENQNQSKLKDLFTPREDEVGFSLLGHLDLDFEVEDMLGISDLTCPTESAVPHAPAPQMPDPNPPFFFPLPPTLRSRSSGTKPGFQDIFSLFPYGGQGKEGGGKPFFRTHTTSDIHSRWEAKKGALTREWKARWREAAKGKRGRDE